VVVLLVSSLLNAAYFFPVVYRGFFAAPKEPATVGIKEAPLFCLIPLSVTAIGSIVLFFYPGIFLELIHKALFP